MAVCKAETLHADRPVYHLANPRASNGLETKSGIPKNDLHWGSTIHITGIFLRFAS